MTDATVVTDRVAAMHTSVKWLTRDEMLAMEGTGWFGDLDDIREGNPPPDVIE